MSTRTEENNSLTYLNAVGDLLTPAERARTALRTLQETHANMYGDEQVESILEVAIIRLTKIADARMTLEKWHPGMRSDATPEQVADWERVKAERAKMPF